MAWMLNHALVLMKDGREAEIQGVGHASEEPAVPCAIRGVGIE
jgi:hypothetical protein